MNFAEIEAAWRSPQNRPSRDEVDEQKREFVAQLKRRRRGFALFLSIVIASLILITGRAVLLLIHPGDGRDPVDLSREWSFLLMLALPWAAAVAFAWQQRNHKKRYANYNQTIAQTTRALLDQNRLARARLKLVAALHGVLLLLLPVVVFQLRSVGKAGDEILLPAFVIWPLIAVGIILSLWIHDRRKLRPEKDRLESLAAAYEGAERTNT